MADSEESQKINGVFFEMDTSTKYVLMLEN